MNNKFKPDRRSLKGFSLIGPETGGISVVESNGGKITRIRPYHYELLADGEEANPWKIEARGATFQPSKRIGITPFGLTYKARVYSSNRVKYPLKRVDWDPNG